MAMHQLPRSNFMLYFYVNWASNSYDMISQWEFFFSYFQIPSFITLKLIKVTPKKRVEIKTGSMLYVVQIVLIKEMPKNDSHPSNKTTALQKKILLFLSPCKNSQFYFSFKSRDEFPWLKVVTYICRLLSAH